MRSLSLARSTTLDRLACEQNVIRYGVETGVLVVCELVYVYLNACLYVFVCVCGFVLV